MRFIVRFLLPMILMAAIVMIVLALLGLERYSRTPAMHDRIRAISISQLGRPLSYDELELDLLPPGLKLTDVSLPGRAPNEPDFFKAHQLDLRIALLPLLRMAVIIDSLQIEGLDIELIRDDSGLDWPSSSASSTSEAEAESAPSGKSWFSKMDWGVRHLRVRNARVVLIDKTITPAETFGLKSIDWTISRSGAELPVRIDFQADSIGGGRLTVRGNSNRQGRLDLEMTVSDLDLSGAARSLALIFDRKVETQATLSGKAHVRGPWETPEALNFEAEISSSALRWDDYDFTGRIDLKGEFDALRPKVHGNLTLDAMDAAISLGDFFHKPKKTPLHVDSEWSVDAGSGGEIALERIELASINASGKINFGENFELRLETDAFPASALALLSPQLSGQGARGNLIIQGLVYQHAPLAIQGSLRAEGLHVDFKDGGGLSLSARLLGQGQSVILSDGNLSAGDQHLSITGKVEELSGKLPFKLNVETPTPIRANAFLSGLSPTLEDALYGPVMLRTQLTGSGAQLGSEAEFFDSLNGTLNLQMGKAIEGVDEGGRIVGFSLLSSLFSSMAKYGQLTRLTHLLLGDKAPDLSDQTEDAFEKAELISKVDRGVCEIQSAELVETSYSAKLLGNMRLIDLSLDLRGQIQLGEKTSAVLGTSSESGNITIPIAHIGGTLSAPKVDLSESAVLALSRQLVSKNVAVKTLLDGTDKVLPGAGALLGSGLDTLLLGNGEAKKAEKQKAAELPSETNDASKPE